MQKAQEIECEDCMDTGLIEVESVSIGRPYMKDGKLVQDWTGHGNWHKDVCPCRS